MEKTSKIQRDASTGQYLQVKHQNNSRGVVGEVLGVTKDGVKILRPKFPPKNFTERELREAVAKALETSPAKSA